LLHNSHILPLQDTTSKGFKYVFWRLFNRPMNRIILLLLLSFSTARVWAQSYGSEVFMGINALQFTPGQHDEGYASAYSDLPSGGLSLGGNFRALYFGNIIIHSGVEVHFHRQNVSYTFDGERVKRETEYKVGMLSVAIPLKWYLLNNDRFPLKIYVKSGLNYNVINRAYGERWRNRRFGRPDSLFWISDVTEIREPVPLFRSLSVPLEGGLKWMPNAWNGHGIGLAYGMFVTPFTRQSSPVRYGAYWVALRYQWRIFGLYQSTSW